MQILIDEIGENEIYYKRFPVTDDIRHVTAKSLVVKIVYSDGEEEWFAGKETVKDVKTVSKTAQKDTKGAIDKPLPGTLAPTQRGIVKFHPVPLLTDVPTISLGYEHVLSEKSTLQFNIDYATETDSDFKSTWFGIGAEYRLYNLIPSLNPSRQIAPSGVFLAPTVGVKFFKDIDKIDNDPEYNERYSFAHAGVLAGYQWLPTLKNGSQPLALEASVGLLEGFMLKGDSFDYEDYVLWPRFSLGLVPTVNVSIGFAFGK